MKAITVKQPWANLICSGIKDIENRTWKTNYRGRVLIHAAADKNLDKMPLDFVFSKEQLSKLKEKYTEFDLCKRYGEFGAIIGSVEIVDCVINHESIWAEKTDKFAQIFIKPTYNWILANPILFEEPIPAKGKLSFWEYHCRCNHTQACKCCFSEKGVSFEEWHVIGLSFKQHKPKLNCIAERIEPIENIK